MITQRIIDWFMSVLVSLIGTIPPLPQGLADFLASLNGVLLTVFEKAQNFSQIIPFTTISTALGAIILTYSVVFTVRIIALAISAVTGRKVLPR